MKVVTCAVAVVALAGVAGADPQSKPKPKSTAPHGVTSIELDYTWTSFSSDAAHYSLQWTGKTFTVGKREVDPKLVDALYASLTALRDVPTAVQCISHTDDYPKFDVVIAGDEPVELSSSSNCHAYVPWNVRRGDKLQAQYSGDVWRALAPILAASDDKWKRAGNQPIASTSFGREDVMLGSFGGHGPASPDAEKCAHALEADRDVHKILGDLHVHELALACSLNTSQDCSVTYAHAEITVQGVNAEVDIPCTAGAVTLPVDVLVALNDLGKLLATKPVRVLVKLAAEAPRVWFNGGWSVEGGVALPTLTWDPHEKVIEARLISDDKPKGGFWQELHLDPAPLSHKEQYFWETVARLDFTGKLVH